MSIKSDKKILATSPEDKQRVYQNMPLRGRKSTHSSVLKTQSNERDSENYSRRVYDNYLPELNTKSVSRNKDFMSIKSQSGGSDLQAVLRLDSEQNHRVRDFDKNKT